MPTSFMTDDQLYEGREQSSIAEERTESAAFAFESAPAPDTDSDDKNDIAIAKSNSVTLGRFVHDSVGIMGVSSMAAGVALSGFILMCWHQLSRIVSGSLAILALLLCAMPLATPLTIERAYLGHEEGMLNVHGLMGNIRAIVDSGCTSTAVPEHLIDLLHEVTEPTPNRKLYIANDKGLDILKIGKANLKVQGYKKEHPHIRLIETLPISRMLVVRGMAKDQILLSVRGMKKDGVYTYFNDDNSIRTSDCIRLPNGSIVPFRPSSHAYNLSVTNHDHALAGADAPTFPRQRRAPSLVHAAIGHSGARRINASNISMDGHVITIPEHDESTCKGCRLGNSGKGHVPTRKSSWREGDSSVGFSHFGQQFDTDICTGFEPSFPHGFTAMINFCDRWGHETYVRNADLW